MGHEVRRRASFGVLVEGRRVVKHGGRGLLELLGGQVVDDVIEGIVAVVGRHFIVIVHVGV